MGFHFHFDGNQNGSTPRWYRILVDLAIMSMCAVLLFRTVPHQRLLVLPIFGLGIAFGGINLYRELRQLYKERAKEDDNLCVTDTHDSLHRNSRFCPYCGKALQDDFEFCNGCGKRLP